MPKLLISTVRFLLVSVALIVIPANVFSQKVVQFSGVIEPIQEPSAPAPKISDEVVLLKAGIERTPQGLKSYFLSLLPNKQAEKRIGSLIDQLGDSRFSRREQAMIQLLKLQKPPEEFIRQKLKTVNDEVRWRLQTILTVWSDESDDILQSALKYVAGKQVKGLTEPLSKIHSICQSRSLSYFFRDAFISTATESDIEKLLDLIGTQNNELRIFSMETLYKIAPKKANSPLKVWLASGSETQRMFASELLAQSADKAVLFPLLELMQSDSISIRTEASMVLKSITKKKLGYNVYDPDSKRAKSLDQWRKWLEENEQTVQLVAWEGSYWVEKGINLVASYGEGKVYVFDRNWKLIRTLTAVGPWDVELLPNGNYLVACYDGNAVVEYTPLGKEVGRISTASPWSAQRLANGRTLIASGQFAMEFDGKGDEVWRSPQTGGLSAAVRLPNGNTLLSQYSPGAVIEVNPAGKTIRQIDGLTMPYMLQALPNGNILLPDKSANKLVEYDRTGKVVWEKEGLNSPDSCQRLPNQHLIVTENQKLTEYDENGKVIFSKTFNSSQLKIRRF